MNMAIRRWFRILIFQNYYIMSSSVAIVVSNFFHAINVEQNRRILS